MARILIVGIGNRLCSDDGVGWRLASELSREIGRDDVHIIATQQLTPELAEMASCAQRMLFVDAATKGEPGTLELRQITPGSSSRHSHELSPAGVLKLAQDLYGHSPRAYLLTIAGETFSTGDILSPSVAAGVPKAKAEIARFIDVGERESD